MTGSERSLVTLRVRSTPADRSGDGSTGRSRLVTLVPVPRVPPDTVALPLLTPGDLIRAARARRAEKARRDGAEESGTTSAEPGGDTATPVFAVVPAPRAPLLPARVAPAPHATAPDATAPDATAPDATRPMARVPGPRRPVGPVGHDPLAAVLTSLRPAPARRPTPRPGRVPLVLAVVLAVVGVVLLVLALVGQSAAPAARDTGDLTPLPTSAVPPVAPPSAPTRLVVPGAAVNSAVRQVGLAADRSMEVPAPGPDYDLAAWYRYSVTPGQQGPSVIVGHVDSRTRGASVFFALGRLRPGDRMSVGRADGSVVDFVVYATRTVAKDAFPTAEVYGPTPGPELRLITCGGSFDTAGHSYRDNVVVFARRV